MAKIDETYHDLLVDILQRGFRYKDPNRKGVERVQIPNYTLIHNFEDGFPAITTKKLFWKGVVGELLWFLRGERNIKTLQDWGIKIWDKDVANFSDTGDAGRIYGVQWRDFNGKVDQVVNLVNKMRQVPMATDLIVTAWNPAELDEMALPPCHWSFQILPTPEGFYLQWNQRSVDVFLGLPFNIASYALLAKILEIMTGRKALGIIGQLSNVHLYDIHLGAVAEQLRRDVNKYEAPFLSIQPNTQHKLTWYRREHALMLPNIDDFVLGDYKSYPAIKAEMLPYNK